MNFTFLFITIKVIKITLKYIKNHLTIEYVMCYYNYCQADKYADVAELADALVLGTSVIDVEVQVLSSAPKVDLLELVENIETSEFEQIKN